MKRRWQSPILLLFHRQTWTVRHPLWSRISRLETRQDLETSNLNHLQFWGKHISQIGYENFKGKKQGVKYSCKTVFFHFEIKNRVKTKLSLKKFEPSHEIMVFFIFRKIILQTRMHSHPIGLDVWFFVGPFVYFHTLWVWEQRRLWRDCMDAQASLSLRCRLCDENHNLTSWLIYWQV